MKNRDSAFFSSHRRLTEFLPTRLSDFHQFQIRISSFGIDSGIRISGFGIRMGKSDVPDEPESPLLPFSLRRAREHHIQQSAAPRVGGIIH